LPPNYLRDANTSAEMMRGFCVLAFCAANYKRGLCKCTDTLAHIPRLHICASGASDGASRKQPITSMLFSKFEMQSKAKIRKTSFVWIGKK
jgi:Tfp pilus assembly protein PilV